MDAKCWPLTVFGVLAGLQKGRFETVCVALRSLCLTAKKRRLMVDDTRKGYPGAPEQKRPEILTVGKSH